MPAGAPKVGAMTTTEFSAPEQVQRFIFEGKPVRGHWVGMGQGWRDLRQFREYSPPVQELLGQAVCAALLLAATLKFKGTLTLQLQGNGCGRPARGPVRPMTSVTGRWPAPKAMAPRPR